ncbi:hypothetical protein [Tunicatimonas pelagia]|uniref:hypothetical protein n=1 Tax=Tunicatimonas pelagia TaxID=931531 RepID=UPI002664E42A|nr:hypothetical protein [Tunicatimonas pelagia]WKN41425.1 hypothetical protein P0M28_20525 [Tunicatimonas pelagia]
MIKLFLFLLLNGFFLSLAVLGQKNYTPGYVVLISGDTLRGQVMDRRETFTGTELLDKIRFKPEGGGLRRKYRAKKLLAYRANDNIYERHQLRPKGISLLDAYYEIVPNGGEPVFLRVVSRGKVTYYQWEWVDPDDSTTDTADYFRKGNEPLLVRATQGIFGLKRKNLTEYFQDCPSLQEKIQQKVFKYPFEVANYYNQNCR